LDFFHLLAAITVLAFCWGTVRADGKPKDETEDETEDEFFLQFFVQLIIFCIPAAPGVALGYVVAKGFTVLPFL
jgi:hypothetical protein